MLGFLAWALAAEPAPRAFGPGELQAQVGMAFQFNGYDLSVLPLIEGWHPLHASVDAGLLRLGSVTVGIGAEASTARQVLVNPMMRVRALIGDVRFLPGAGEEADWRWSPRLHTAGGRLTVHPTKMAGFPFFLMVVERAAYRLDGVHREDGRTTSLERDLWVGALGAGVSSLLPSGLLVSGEVRYSHRITEIGRWVVPVAEDVAIGLPRRMAGPAPVLMRFSLGVRLGGRKVSRPSSSAAPSSSSGA